MIAIDLVENKVFNNILNKSKLIKVIEKIKKRGLLVEFCYNEDITASISIFLPLIITGDEADEVIKIINKSFKTIL